MNWEFYAEADISGLDNRPWYPKGVNVYKRLVDSDGNVITSVKTTLEDILSTCDDTSALAADYLATVKSHFDIQYDLVYTGRDEPHQSVAIAFGQTLSACISTYRAILNQDPGEI